MTHAWGALAQHPVIRLFHQTTCGPLRGFGRGSVGGGYHGGVMLRAAAKWWCGRCVPLLRLQEHSVIVRGGGSMAAVLCTNSTSHTALGLLVDRACSWPRNAPKYAGSECVADSGLVAIPAALRAVCCSCVWGCRAFLRHAPRCVPGMCLVERVLTCLQARHVRGRVRL